MFHCLKECVALFEGVCHIVCVSSSGLLNVKEVGRDEKGGFDSTLENTKLGLSQKIRGTAV